MVLRRQHSAGYLANHMARLFAIALGERLQPLGLATAQFAVLLELWNNDAITQKELVELLDIEQATVGNTVQRMERDGLIVRKPHPKDGRSHIICLTAKARALETSATRQAMAVNSQALGTLTDSEKDVLLELMRRVVERQRAHRKPSKE